VPYASARAMQPGLAPLGNGSRLCYCSDGKDTCVEDYGLCIQNTNALVRPDVHRSCACWLICLLDILIPDIKCLCAMPPQHVHSCRLQYVM
jgi:hypothetical protein